MFDEDSNKIHKDSEAEIDRAANRIFLLVFLGIPAMITVAWFFDER